MQSSNVKATRKYKVENLPKFFKKRSKDISKVFSNEVVELSTIRSKSVTSDIQEFSFKLKLLTSAGEDISDTILPRTKHLVGFFKIYLFQEESFMVNIKVPKESSELYNNHCKANNYKTVEEFISNAPIEILLQGIKITLQTDVKNINLGSLHQTESFLNEKLKYAERTENDEQSLDTLQVEGTESEDKKRQSAVQQEKVQNKQIVSGSFGYNVASKRKQVSIAVAAMRENASWLRSFFRPPDFFSKIQFFFQQAPELSTQKQNALTYHSVPQDQKCAEKDQEMGATRPHTEYFKANRKESKKQTKELSEEERQFTIKQAQNDVRVAMIDNRVEHKGKKLDKIFVEVMSEYKNQDPETFRDAFNSVFSIVYFQGKQLHEVLDSDEISKVLEILEIPQPTGKSSLSREYLQRQVCREKEQLLKLVSGIRTQQPSPQPENISHESRNPLPNKTTNPLPVTNKAPPATNASLKSLLKNVFSSKETYFCLFLVAASISILCLWHLPLGKASVLKGLVPPEGRESIGLALNIGLPILIALCVLGLAHFIYSEYSVKSIEQVGKNKFPSCT